MSHPSTATRERAVPCRYCRQPTWDDSAVCAHVGCQNAERLARRQSASPAVDRRTAGERVRFVGLLAQPWETTGAVAEVRGEFVLVVWDSDPYDHPRPIHASQVEPTDAPPSARCQHRYNVPLLVSVVPKGMPCALCGEPYR